MYHVPMFDLDFSLETRVEWTLDAVAHVRETSCGESEEHVNVTNQQLQSLVPSYPPQRK